MKYETRNIQERLLSMLAAFHTICATHNLTYYIVAGTLLGARRHNGFIPWDDDVDVAMPREDYIKLESINISTSFPDFELKYYKNTKKSPIHYLKMVDKTTTLIEKNYHNYIEGLYIDIFPLDGTNEKTRDEFSRWRTIWKLNNIIMNHCRTERKPQFIKEMKRMTCKVIPLQLVHKKLERKITEVAYEKARYAINFFGAYKERECVSKELFGKPKLYSFETIKVYGPQDGDAYLESLYGDFWQLPPLEERKNKHDFYYLDLSKPYADYSKQVF